MLFNSWNFLIFFPLVYVVYYGLPFCHRWKWLLFSSCIFYMAFIPFYILILFVIIIIDYVAGIFIVRYSGYKKNLILLLSIGATCLVLFFFKYHDFVAKNINWLSNFWGLNLNLRTLELILPLGLSFHTFQSLSYTIEVYRGNQKPEKHFGIYALYVLFFPQLVAGPIERPQNMLHQFHRNLPFNSDRLTSGLRLLLWGLFKKVVIADHLATYVDPVFLTPSDFSTTSIGIAVIFFYFQIYCDFSGYTDIAIGSARMLGYDLMKNFNVPFLSKSMTDFWKRWHISLSTWLRDYIYEPLALNWRHQGFIGISAALILTFLISGFWHGAEWTFIIWGLAHGLLLVMEFLWGYFFKFRINIFPDKICTLLGIARTFILVSLSYILFRSKNLDIAIDIYEKLLIGLINFPEKVYGIYINGIHFINFSQDKIINHSYADFFNSLIFIFSLILIEKLHAERKLFPIFNSLPSYFKIILYQIFCLILLIYGTWFTQHSTFIYFQF